MASSPNESTRICVVGSGWRFTSGISYYTCRLTAALAETHPTSALLMRQLVPTRMYPGRDRVGQPVHGIDYPPQVPVFDGIDWFWLPSLLRALRFLRKQRPQVIVLQWWTGAVLHSYLAIAAMAHSIGAKLLIEFHEIQDTGEAKLPGASRYLNTVGKALVGRADGYVVHSEFDRGEVERIFAVTGKPLAVMNHGPFDHHVDVDQPVAPDRREPGARKTILFFGTIRPYKGLEHLIEAFEALDPAVADELELLVVGETWEGWTQPIEMIARSPRRSQITLVNRYVRDAEIAEFFAAADIVALPYTRSSASGPLHIAMSYGLPIVLTDVGGLRDGADGYEGIVWAPPSDVTALAAALRLAAAKTRERFTDPRSWADSVDVYDQLIGKLG